MTEPQSSQNTTSNNGVPPQKREKTKISKIWLLPMIAVLIGIGMVYNDWQNRGILIQVMFETAEGLEAGKTVLKSRNVDIGMVKRVGFNEEKTHILVDIEVQKDMEAFIVEDSQFWVVRPRIGARGITGISTLLSGAYIELSPGKSFIEKYNFVGLENPPVTPSNADGLHLRLVSRGSETLNIGNPVLYQGFEVGAVESKSYDDLEEEAHYDIFINAPYHNLITANTAFWNVSGFRLSMTAEGVSFDVASLDALFNGGVEFGLPDGEVPGKGVPQNHLFTVYDSLESIEEEKDYAFIEYVILVEDSVSGLYKGAPVEYRGIRVGTVSEPYMQFLQIAEIAGYGNEERIPVVVRIEPERLLGNQLGSLADFKQVFDNWIKEGLTAFVESANLVTGSLKIALSPGDEPKTDVEYFGKFPIIPATIGGFESITQQLDSILATLNTLPLNDTVDKVNTLIDSADKTIQSAGSAINTAENTIKRADTTLLALENTLQELQTTLKGVQPNSDIYLSLQDAIVQLEATLNDVRPLVKEITNKPSSLIFGESAGPDREPKPKSMASQEGEK
ncbi:intermembrane transport protein PqiB [Agaribacter marinus]|uniref:Paraquat-inducible protein B n=1 Tax=Agaribacter marinus TaxID=1431249 RepID=A0AA37STY7_9ALTE|nr:intermembrane transport protein PqiB [Agaribacter marinus]GLR69147.1 paraquat-inducible protein B [Agaribacter marinus]